MSKRCYSLLIIRYFGFYFCGNFSCASLVRTLRNNYNSAGLILSSLFKKIIAQAINICVNLGDYSGFSTCRDCSIESNKTGIPAHNFHKENKIVRVCGVSNFIYCLNGSIYCSVKTNCEISSKYIIINSSRKSDNWKIIFCCKQVRASKRAVSSNNYQRINGCLS